jgi:hypothetical protein
VGLAGAPTYNSTFWCDTTVTNCYSLQNAQPVWQHSGNCLVRGGAVWVPSSYDEQVRWRLALLCACMHACGCHASAAQGGRCRSALTAVVLL